MRPSVLSLGVGAFSALAGCSSSSGSSSAGSFDSGQDTMVVAEASADGMPPEAATDANVAESGSSDSEAPGFAESGPDGGCDPDSNAPEDLSCTGLYLDWSSKTLAPGVMAYTPAFTLWSDGMQKSRWIRFPAGSQIDTSNLDDWTFPVGTKVWKEFRWPAVADGGTLDGGGVDEGGVVAGNRVETRLLWKTASGWNVLVYRWSPDESSAPLFLGGATNVDGTTYEIPTVGDCYTCHNGRQDFLLGFDLVGTGAPGAVGVTLASLADAGLLSNAPPSTTIQIPEDSTGLAVPALGFMHMNCGVSCHNADFGAMAVAVGLRMKLLAGQMYPDAGSGQVAQLDTYTTSVNVPGNDTPNGMQYLRIDPGSAQNSLVPLMSLARAPDAGGFSPMPPIVSHEPDPVDVAKMQAWINAL